ncbi:MAG: metal-dependent hydrolase [Nanoarchaeota archaeon]|nr:metal-dependent hydrolase [Nanoarchaeota archaeon]MBU1027641.1 metal-dependent hydrolase [Nanoarchaeota archaeon]
MYPQTHFLFSWLVGLIFVKLGFFNYKIALFVGLIGLFVDIDHYIKFVFSKGDFNLKDAFNRMARGVFSGRSFIHHWIGFVIITLIVVFLYLFNKNLFWILSLGYYSHIFLDYAHLNVLKIKGKLIIKEFGFVEKVDKFEILFDIFLVIGVVLFIL